MRSHTRGLQQRCAWAGGAGGSDGQTLPLSGEPLLDKVGSRQVISPVYTLWITLMTMFLSAPHAPPPLLPLPVPCAGLCLIGAKDGSTDT